ncbi:helix-turn-helix domain-containing protein [Streptomyces sp. NPDC048172]|uniref:helix-turn-helix domain-containing protein n=1 Tax=Streptomyces sp. NPDC048172 TaxID=3365505 RepID=UPI003719E2FE
MQDSTPFDAGAARRFREALGLTPAHVAYGMRAAFGQHVDPRLVAAWEQGTRVPDERQLTALAGALWCSPAHLLRVPRTLREHRLAHGVSAPDLALEIGMDPAAYERVEATGQWTGNARQAEALGRALRLPLPALLAFTGREEELTGLLRRAVTTRWQAYTSPVARLVPLPKDRLEEALRELHDAYASTTAGSLNWAAGSTGSAGPAFLEEILRHFWAALEA